MVLKRRAKIIDNLTEFLGQKLEGDVFFVFVDRVQDALPEGISRITVHNSVKHLLKKQLTPAQLMEMSWRLAGNINQLVGNHPVPQWTRQRNFEWIPAQVCEVQTVKKHKQLMHELVFQSLAGTIVPRKLTQSWSMKKTSYLATYRNDKRLGFGFGRSHINNRGEQTGHSLFYDVRQFYGMRCFLLLDPQRSHPEPFAIEVGHTHSTMTYNKQLIVARDRNRTACIKGLPDSQECYHCPLGTDKCVLATHLLTYTQGVCPRCKAQSFFDPAEIEHLNMCINCVFEMRRK
jgi:hypothetical protein